MVVANEDLLMEMQRVGALMRHGHHRHLHGHGHPHGGPHGHTHGACRHKGSGKHGQKRILAMLAMQDGVSQKDLAFLLGIRPQSLTIALEKLEAESLIERKQDEDDKRTRRVYITEAGKERAATDAEERTARADGVFAALTDEEKDQLASILAKLAATLEKNLSSEQAPCHPTQE